MVTRDYYLSYQLCVEGMILVLGVNKNKVEGEFKDFQNLEGKESLPKTDGEPLLDEVKSESILLH